MAYKLHGIVRILRAATMLNVAVSSSNLQGSEKKLEVARTKYVRLEMYAVGAHGDDFSKPENLDLFDAAGLAKYLMTEVVVETGKPPDRTKRDKGIDTVVKYSMRVLNNRKSSDVDVQGEFAQYVPFMNGAAINPNDTAMYERSGDLVGLQAYHPPAGDVRYPMDTTFYWFSLSGPCPNLPSAEKKSAKCIQYKEGLVPPWQSQYVAGGLCHPFFTKHLPDGAPGCVYYVENYTSMELDRLVGVNREDCGGRVCTTWLDFRLHCTDESLKFTDLGVTFCREYDYPECLDSCTDASCESEKEVGIPFWKGRCNSTRNAERETIIREAFGGSSAEKHYASNPPCENYSPMCSNPVPDVGVSYCHRDASGICDLCYVPGTLNPTPKPQSQVRCRLDLFLNKKLHQYKDAMPRCSSDCSGECSMDTDKDTCCLYIGKCKRDWEHEEEWSSCSATCGNGTRHRRVWCPFEEILGPCDESRRPVNVTDCRGDMCPWDHTDFGQWGQCNNGCGSGSQAQSLVCKCPDHCPLGDKECAKSPKPKQPQRPCFPISDASGKSKLPDFCAECSLAGGTCQKCLDGFQLGSGKVTCHSEVRVAKATYRLSANSSLLHSGWLASALVPAFLSVLAQISKTSLQAVHVVSDSVAFGTSTQTSGKADHFVDIVVAARSKEDSDESLNATSRALEEANLKQLVVQLPQALEGHGCTATHNCSVPPGLTCRLLEAPDLLCPGSHAWVERDGCSEPKPVHAGGVPGWAIACIVVVVLVLVAALSAWTSCFGRCKRSNMAREPESLLHAG